jgi:hypothetical protein
MTEKTHIKFMTINLATGDMSEGLLSDEQLSMKEVYRNPVTGAVEVPMSIIGGARAVWFLVREVARLKAEINNLKKENRDE